MSFCVMGGCRRRGATDAMIRTAVDGVLHSCLFLSRPKPPIAPAATPAKGGMIADGDVVPMLMTQFLPGPVLGLVFLGAIAAIHSTAAPYIGTGGTILLRDVYWRYTRKQQASHSEQIWVNRALSTAVTLAAVVVSLTARDAIVMIGGFATGFGFVMYLLLLGVHWVWRFPSLGATLGMIASIVACFLTYCVWRYPLSMHTAFWGLFAGLTVAYLRLHCSWKVRCFYFTVAQSQAKNRLNTSRPNRLPSTPMLHKHYGKKQLP